MDKLSYKLDCFEGPLDLLLHLIAKSKVDIKNIMLVDVIDQYIDHVKQMQIQDMDIASEFLDMASRLIYLKTVSLLPKHEEAEQLKQELTQELMEYEHCRKVAALMQGMTEGFDRIIKPVEKIDFDMTYENKHESSELIDAYISAIGRGKRKLPPPTTIFSKIVARKIVSVSSKIVYVLRNVIKGKSKKMSALFSSAKSRSELVATFLAVLELCKANRVIINGNGEEAELSVNRVRKNKNED